MSANILSKSRKENLSLSRQEVPEIILGWFLALVFATRDLQNDMFCQALDTENDFRYCLEPHSLREGKIILII